MASIKIFSLGGLDKKSNDLTRSPDKASDMINMEYDTQSTLKKRNGYEVFSNSSCDDMVYYNSKNEFLLFQNGSSNIQILDSAGTLKTYNGSTSIPLSAGIPALVNPSISYCENQNNLYFTNTDYTTYVMKYDGSNVYRAGLPTPRIGTVSKVDQYPALSTTPHPTLGNVFYHRLYYSYKDINGNEIFSPYVQYSGLGIPSGLNINSFAFDSNCVENGFFDKYCYKPSTLSTAITSIAKTLPLTRHNYVAGDKFLVDTENFNISISPSDKTFMVLDIESVQNNDSDAVFTASTSGTTMNVTAVTSGTIKIGSKITGSGLLADTYIVAFGTGSGGIGTYTISVSQTLSSRSMTQVTTSITFTSASISTYTITFSSSSSYSVEYPVDTRCKFFIASSQNESSNYKVALSYVLDNSSSLFSKAISPAGSGEPCLGWAFGATSFTNFEDIYDSATAKVMPPICKYIGSFGNQIVYGAIKSFFTSFSTLLNSPNRRVQYANTELIAYSDISTGDGPENVSELNLVKVGETWDGYITGVRRCNDSMIIFKNRGVFSIDGTLIDGEFQIRKITTNFAGCTSHKSILEADEGLYFQAHNGLYFTNAISVKKISYEIDSVFGSADYDKTRAVRLKKKQKSLFYVPTLSKVVVVDYYYNQIYFWDSVTASSGFVENSLGDVFFSNGSSIYKFNNSYSDNGSAINAYYATTWHHAGEPSLNKKWLSIRTFSLATGLDSIFNLTIKTQGDWDTTDLTTNTILFGANDQTKFTMLDMKTKRSLRFIFSNAINNQNLVITGYEINFEVFNSVDKN